ncbi:MAG: SRPBCC domain-containing protein [Bacteroidia bacterium]|nr:SRPBCC domain-containing protein [Bacteroidia bacterium]
MKNENFTYSFNTAKSVEEVFDILLDVKKWWSGLFEETITGKSRQPNDEFVFKAGGGVHNTKQRLIELIPGKKVVWLVTESSLTFLKEPKEWEGTKFRFDLESDGKRTNVTFTHEGLTPEIECYADCSAGWSGYMDKLKIALN